MHVLLKSNPSFARVCGFVPRQASDEYSSEHIPSLRKLEQFDQDMTAVSLSFFIVSFTIVYCKIEVIFGIVLLSGLNKAYSTEPLCRRVYCV